MTNQSEQAGIAATIKGLKTATQLNDGASILRRGQIRREDVHQVVFNIDGANDVTIMGVEIGNATGDDVYFVPWHAVDVVYPA